MVATGAAVWPRPAATLMLVRDRGSRHDALEVLLVQRNLRSVFAQGAHVFPGGAVDAADGDPLLAQYCTGLDDIRASERLGLQGGGLAYWVAAIRECFEEAGILLASDRDGNLLSLSDPATAARFAGHRDAMRRGERRLLEVCRDEELALATDCLHYVAHWITPVGPPRRFDTRFFVALAPQGQAASHDAGETIADEWVVPQEALERSRQGQIEILRPTAHNLGILEGFSNVAALLQSVDTIDVTIEPHDLS